MMKVNAVLVIEYLRLCYKFNLTTPCTEKSDIFCFRT